MYPFSAIVGQEDAKLALLLVSVDPGIGGVLLSGVKGTGKSTLVRALPSVLPELEVVADCPYNCDPKGTVVRCERCQARLKEGGPLPSVAKNARIVTLPLGTSEDRLLGTVDVEKLLRAGEVHFEPGLLAEANRQVLYVDEVNLLPDNLTDDVLDAAASGVNTVEREGISVTHPAVFTLIGTMNPEEGQLRPQILDRFALSVKMETITSPALRAEIVRRSLAQGASPERFAESFAEVDRSLQERIRTARARRETVRIFPWIIDGVATAMANLGVDGQRPDIAAVRSAVAYAALEGDGTVQEKHLEKTALLAVSHRTRNGGLDAPPDPDGVRRAMDEALASCRERGGGEEAITLGDFVEQVLSQGLVNAGSLVEDLKKND